jgi:hypothetical protein
VTSAPPFFCVAEVRLLVLSNCLTLLRCKLRSACHGCEFKLRFAEQGRVNRGFAEPDVEIN